MAVTLIGPAALFFRYVDDPVAGYFEVRAPLIPGTYAGSLVEVQAGYDNSPHETDFEFTVISDDAPAQTGPITASAERTAIVPKVQLGTLVSDLIPRGSVVWKQAYDPADHAPYAFDFTDLLANNEGIASIERIRLTASATTLGLSVDLLPQYRPVIDVVAGKKIQLWFLTDPDKQEAAAFDNAGVVVGVTIRILTNSVPPKTYERTSVLTVRQQ